MGKLTPTALKAASEPERYGDGEGLFQLVGKSGGKSWMVGTRGNIRRGASRLKPLTIKDIEKLTASRRSTIRHGY